jgi:SagB-type dehydrogenase family enzyme
MMKIKYIPSVKGGKGLFLISELFHENTKCRKDGFGIGSPPGFTDTKIKKHLLANRKKYHYSEVFDLPKNFSKKKEFFEDVIKKRRTIRNFSGRNFSLEEISRLLFYAYGITNYIDIIVEENTHKYPLRASPSAGALYPIDIFLISFKVSGLKKGIYYFNSIEHKLELIRRGNYLNFFCDNCPNVDPKTSFINNASIILALCGDFSRTKFKYGERGYRYVLIDAGHLGQNIYLVATYMDLGVVGIQGFFDDEINRLLGLDGVEESTIYLFSLGKK